MFVNHVVLNFCAIFSDFINFNNILIILFEIKLNLMRSKELQKELLQTLKRTIDLNITLLN